MLFHRHAMDLLRLLYLLGVGSAYCRIVVLIALDRNLTCLLSNVVTESLMLVEDKRVSVWIHRLLLLRLLDTLITLNGWSVNLKLF